MDRETMEFDVVVVGAGPAGLALTIRLLQLNPALSVVVLEKGSAVGAHNIAGAVLDPHALNELLPDWKNCNAPIQTAVTRDQFLWLTQQHAWRLPTPSPMRNPGNYIISIGRLCAWLAQEAETLGAQIYPGFAASDIVYDAQGAVRGVIAGESGINKRGEKTPQYQPGMQLLAKQVVFAEGCRGSLTKQVMERFQLNRSSQPQTYGIGFKELWEIDPAQHQLGSVMHSLGWPLDQSTYGGGFLYHIENNQVSVGFVIGLDYQNPYLNPFEEFQRFKNHPALRSIFVGGKRIGYGARAIAEGGFQSLPQLTFPGGLLIGDTAGFLNVPKIKGIHTAMKSGMVAAETIAAAFASGNANGELKNYRQQLEKSWLWDELYRARNIRPAFRWGLLLGLVNAVLDTYIFRGRAPWTFNNHADHLCLKPARACKKIIYPKPDNVVTFDKLSSVYLSNVSHEEDQQCHLQLRDPTVAITVNLAEYDAPEQRYCPAAVYEIVRNVQGEPQLQINAGNCIHCKTCDIKDPTQNINWIAPEGGGGPHYSGM